MKTTDLWIDWHSEGEVNALLDKVEENGIPPHLGREFAARLQGLLLESWSKEDLQGEIDILSGVVEEQRKEIESLNEELYWATSKYDE